MGRKSVPKVTKLLLIALTTLSIINSVLKYYTYFTLISTQHDHHTSDNQDDHLKDFTTGKIPHPHDLYVPFLTYIPTRTNMLLKPWIFVTCSLIEEGLISLTSSFILIYYLGTYLETLWSSKEFAKFVVFDMISSNIVLIVFFFVKSLKYESIAPPNVFTATALVTGLLVGVKQRIPNHYLLFFKGNLRIKVSSVPFIVLVGCYIISFMNADYLTMFQLGVSSLISTWLYLRFFKEDAGIKQLTLLPLVLKTEQQSASAPSFSASTIGDFNSQKNVRGDRSEQFSFYTFFPHPLSKIARAFFNFCFHILIKVNLIDQENFSIDVQDNDHVDMEGFDSRLFGVSSLKGVADNIDALPFQSRAKNYFMSMVFGQKKKQQKSEIDKRRKSALNELDRKSLFD